jgi:hypothetical protein
MKSWAFPPDTAEITDGASNIEMCESCNQCTGDQYAAVEVIDISGFHLADDALPSTFDPRNQADIVSRAFRALREVGFLAIKGHGLRSEDFHHQFDLGKMLIEDVAEANKHDLHAKIWEGSWAGYKVCWCAWWTL